MPPRSPLPALVKTSDQRTAILQSLLIAAIVVTALYVGRDVLLPLALAILLAFVLSPPLLLLRRLKVPRVGAVAIVVAFAFAIIFALGYLLSREATQLAADLPAYQQALSDKVKALRESATASPVFKKAGDVLSELQEQLLNPETDGQAKPPSQVEVKPGSGDGEKIQVEVRQQEPSRFELFSRIAGTVLPPLIVASIVLIFVVFILLQREDLRDRLVRLAGASDIQRATTTMNDAAQRLSKFFLRQLLINAAYGAFITLALWLIGIPSPIVWGVLAALMRFVPFIGSYIAALFPALLAAMIDPGWTMALTVIALYVVGEMTMGQVVEPLVFGRGTGITALALVVSTVFWTWLWGPLGLMMAYPLTVCLAVLGRHVEGLRFFDILLSNEPALTPAQSFYQRTLSGDAAEATYEAELALKDESLQTYLGTVALGGLKLAESDLARGRLDAEEQARIAATVEEMLEHLADFEPRRWFTKLRAKIETSEEDKPTGLASLEAGEEEDDADLPMIARAELAPGWAVEEPVLSIGARSPLDEAAAVMLAAVLNKRGLGAKALPPACLSAGHIASLERTEAKLVCLSYLGLDAGPAQIRYLVRRLRRILPEGTLILVADWGEEGDERQEAQERQAAAEADAYATSLSEAVDLCVKAAKGELKSEMAGEPTPTPSQPKPRRVA